MIDLKNKYVLLYDRDLQMLGYKHDLAVVFCFIKYNKEINRIFEGLRRPNYEIKTLMHYFSRSEASILRILRQLRDEKIIKVLNGVKLEINPQYAEQSGSYIKIPLDNFTLFIDRKGRLNAKDWALKAYIIAIMQSSNNKPLSDRNQAKKAGVTLRKFKAITVSLAQVTTKDGSYIFGKSALDEINKETPYIYMIHATRLKSLIKERKTELLQREQNAGGSRVRAKSWGYQPATVETLKANILKEQYEETPTPHPTTSAPFEDYSDSGYSPSPSIYEEDGNPFPF